MTDVEKVLKRILSDIRVELGEEFDKNFERQCFFSEKWSRRKSPVRGDGHILVDSGALRRSIRSESRGDSIRFFSDLPYGGIHNEGGEIKVTSRMKRFFWAKYYESHRGLGYRKDGSPRQTKKNARLSEDAEWWRALALMKVGKTIKIPRRRFLGVSKEVEDTVRSIIEQNLSDYFCNTQFIINNT